MHIAFFSPAWPLAAHPNGIVTYVHWMREELQRQGHRVSVLTGNLQAPAEDVYEVGESLVRRGRLWLDRRLGKTDGDVFAWGRVIADGFARLHRRSPIDVIEMEESFGWAGTVRQRVDVPVVVKLHGPAFLALVDEERHTTAARDRIEREGAALREAPCIMSPSRSTLEATLARYDLAPAITRHVVNPLALRDDTPIWDRDRSDADTILFVGRFDKLKGGDVVLEAFAALHRRNQSLRLVFVGPDSGCWCADGRKVHFHEAIRRTLTPTAAARVDFRGAVAPTEISFLRPRALVTVVASRWESHSYTALEAMLQGCPVVSTDCGGPSEFIANGRNGLLCKAGDAADLSAKIQVLLDDPHRAAALGSAARRYVQSSHSPAAVVAQTLAAYAEASTPRRQVRASATA